MQENNSKNSDQDETDYIFHVLLAIRGIHCIITCISLEQRLQDIEKTDKEGQALSLTTCLIYYLHDKNKLKMTSQRLAKGEGPELYLAHPNNRNFRVDCHYRKTNQENH